MLLTCPCCYRELHPVCGNPECVCAKRIPASQRPMVNLPNDAEACQYCGFTANIDYWDERNMLEAQLLPPKSYG